MLKENFKKLKIMDKANEHLLVNEEGIIVADMVSEWGHSEDIDVCYSNAKRILLCVNACYNLTETQLHQIISKENLKGNNI